MQSQFCLTQNPLRIDVCYLSSRNKSFVGMVQTFDEAEDLKRTGQEGVTDLTIQPLSANRHSLT
jgi:hypothetical protein